VLPPLRDGDEWRDTHPDVGGLTLSSRLLCRRSGVVKLPDRTHVQSTRKEAVSVSVNRQEDGTRRRHVYGEGPLLHVSSSVQGDASYPFLIFSSLGAAFTIAKWLTTPVCEGERGPVILETAASTVLRGGVSPGKEWCQDRLQSFLSG
jgi:hypothetical protein